MDNLRASIELLFSRENVQRVLDGYFGVSTSKGGGDGYAGDSKDRFVNAHQVDFVQRYNDDQVENIYKIVREDWERLPSVGRGGRDACHPLNVLPHFTECVLREVEGDPVCRYSQLLRWRELTLKLGEDVFTTAFFAYKDVGLARKRFDFGWPSVVVNDNTSLQAMFREEGLSELHFHLKGSTQVFDLNWLSLMNHVQDRSEAFAELRYSQLPDVQFRPGETLLTLHALAVKAAAIRAFLFMRLFYRDRREDVPGFTAILRIEDERSLLFYLPSLQRFINYLRWSFGRSYGEEVVDYAIPRVLPKREEDGQLSATVHHGERRLLYEAFKYVYSGQEDFGCVRQLVYAYLLAKQRLRKELVQLNERIGFKNFQKYEKRKELFIREGSVYSVLVYNMAIHSSLQSGNVDYVEARITPQNSLMRLANSISRIDGAVDDRRFRRRGDDVFWTKRNPVSHCYVLHFIKRAEEGRRDALSDLIHSRSYGFREGVKRQAFAINALRKCIHSSRDRVVGVDAASSEIGCRPEVFATAFRYLKYYSHCPAFQYLVEDSFRSLGFTYHVGEDFLDVVDGLRAVDEVLSFLNFSEGDRIGHGLVLGIDARVYYEKRNRRVIMPKQDFLDNVAWMLSVLPESGMPEAGALAGRLKNWFAQYFVEVYGTSLPVSSRLYYKAWQLRGDDPKHYLGYVNSREDKRTEFVPKFTNFWSKAGMNDFVKDVYLERTDEVIDLYVAYHYDPEVRRKGAEMVEVEVGLDYVNAAVCLQGLMRRRVARKHVAIEVNPSSNQVIGEYKHYDGHPLVSYYNVGLTEDRESLAACPQIHIAIGTDDQGVFVTSLENEFSLMALAMEKCCDGDDVALYNHTHICDWLRRIARMGREHRFVRGV